MPLLVRLHLAAMTVADRLDREDGQTSAEYALVLLGAAAVALLVGVWAKDTNRISKLLDAIVDSIVKMV